jgi:hypothetical protein
MQLREPRYTLCRKAKWRRWQALSQEGAYLHMGTKSDMIPIVSKSMERGGLEPGNQDCQVFSYGFVKKGRNQHDYLAN